MSCALATTGRSPTSRPSLLTKSFWPPTPGIRPKLPDVPLWATAGPPLGVELPPLLDGSRPSDFDTTRDNVPCQLLDMRFVAVMVTPL